MFVLKFTFGINGPDVTIESSSRKTLVMTSSGHVLQVEVTIGKLFSIDLLSCAYMCKARVQNVIQENIRVVVIRTHLEDTHRP